MLSDVDREEQEYKKLRQDKEQIYRSAVDAWQKGDVSNALAKLGVVLELDRKAPDSATPAGGARYQSFYNEVRSEHDAMNTAYADARHSLADRNFAKAMGICQGYLDKYPTNAIFQALRYDIEEQQRQELSALIATVDRQVEAEPDMEKRVGILREALEQYPGEPHFERALRLVQDKRDLVNSIVARAHLHEEQGAYGDALNDWEILRSIYLQYPGLKFEVERLQKKRDQQVRIEVRTRLIEQIDSCMHAGDYPRVFELLQGASAEFPLDEELQSLDKLAHQGLERRTEAQRLMTEGQDLCSKQKPVEGIALLRQAYELDDQNPLTGAMLANALIEHAQTLVEGDWKEAEKLAKEAFELSPSHPMAKTLRTLIQDQKRETQVAESVAQARKLQSEGDLSGALNRAEDALGQYPREMRLIQIRDAVQRDLQAQRRQTRRRDLEELRRLESEASSAADALARQTLGAQARALAGKYPEDNEVLTSINTVLQKLNLQKVEVPSQSTGEKAAAGELTQTLGSDATIEVKPSEGNSEAAPTPAQTPVPQTAKPAASTAQAGPATTRPSTLAAKLRSGEAAKKASVSPSPSSSPSWMIRLGQTRVWATLAVVAVVALAFLLRRHKPLEQPAPAAQPVAVQTPAPAPPPEPQLPAVKLSSDSAGGKITLDDQAPAGLENAQWALDRLPAGEHTLKFESAAGSFTAVVSAAPGEIPTLKPPIEAKGLLAVLISSMGGHVHVYSSKSGIKLSLDGQAPQDVPEDGADFTALSAGGHELALSYGGEQYKLAIEASDAPALNAFVESGQNVGTLVIVCGQDKARVFLNGKALDSMTQGGQLRVANLEPKEYTVRVAKAGFQDVPEQKVRVRKGEQARVAFGLLAVPHMGSLEIQGGPPGATVVIDQVVAGTVQPDGTLSLNNVAPGDHVIELRKDRFKPRQLRKHFVAGAAVSLASAEMALDAAPAELKINFAPADAQVMLTKSGESPSKASSGSTLNLPAGTYTLSARTADGVVRTASVELSAGQSRNLDLSLAPEGMSKWSDPEGWKQENKVFVRKGGDFVLYNSAPAGTIVFSAILSKGAILASHRLQWVVNYTDPNNYVLFQIDDNNFYRTDVRAGKRTEVKIPRKGERKGYHTLQIRVTANEIVHQIKQGDLWVVLDRFSLPGTDLSAGKFGFYIPGGDQVTLASFGHYVDLNLK